MRVDEFGGMIDVEVEISDSGDRLSMVSHSVARLRRVIVLFY